jgi:hypothetical protein
MKKQVGPGAIAVVLVILLTILGAIGYKMFAPKHLPDATDKALRAKYFPNGYPYTKNELRQPAPKTPSGP